MNFDHYFFDLRSLTEGEAAVRDEDPVRGPGWWIYQSPARVLVATRPGQVGEHLDRAAAHAETGWVVGFLTYEAAGALNRRHAVKTPDWPVLAWFALYDAPPAYFRELRPVDSAGSIGTISSDWGYDEFKAAFARVRSALGAGETYQVNLSFRQRFHLDGAAADFFTERCGVDPPPFATFIHGGDFRICSFSPELLFERVGGEVRSSPMKGTRAIGAARGVIPQAARELVEDPKSRAENIMIVDMVRNDLGSVCAPGDVSATELLRVERHGALLQLVSHVRGRFDGPTAVLVRALFPAASITGAPKVATMEIIRDLEPSPRHVYCGTIGVMSPGRQRLSVAIRTALLRGDEGEYGIGSGIVWDSDPDAEFQECLDKRDRLLTISPAWHLLEAIPRADIGRAERVARHLDRLGDSARHLGIPLDRERLERDLAELPDEGLPKVRILVDLDGHHAIHPGAGQVKGPRLRGAPATRPVGSQDLNLRIKTTARAVLDGHLDEHPEADEVLLFNERGELTEFCRGNVILEIDGDWRTPHPESGCLPGIAVGRLIEAGRVRYGALTAQDLERATAVWFINSVAGMVPVDLGSVAKRYTPSYAMPVRSPVVFLFDVDNTLLDHDRVVADMRRHITSVFGPERADAYWKTFNELRDEVGYADYLGALQKYRLDNPRDPGFLDLSIWLLAYPFANRLFPGSLDVVEKFSGWAPTVILSDGDVVFQPRKIQRSGLFEAFEGRVLIYIHKEHELDDVEARYPADHYVLIDDKIRVLTSVKEIWGSRVTTVFPRQGHYAMEPDVDTKYPAPDITVKSIGDLFAFNLAAFRSAC